MRKIMYVSMILGLLTACSDNSTASDQTVISSTDPVKLEEAKTGKDAKVKNKKPSQFQQLVKKNGADKINSISDLRSRLSGGSK